MWLPPRSLNSWLSGVEPTSPFSLANVPLGIISTRNDRSRRVGVALGTWALDLRELNLLADMARCLPGLPDDLEPTSDQGHASAFTSRSSLPPQSSGQNLDPVRVADRDTSSPSAALTPGPGPARPSPTSSSESRSKARWMRVLDSPTLNALAALGRPILQQLRLFIQNLFSDATPIGWLLRDQETLRARVLIPLEIVSLHLPMSIGDYTDFYAGIYHATALGTMFRGPAAALQPNYTHLPVAYAGRASTVVVSHTPVRRPRGQIQVPPSSGPDKSTTSPAPKQSDSAEVSTPSDRVSSTASLPITVPTRALDFEVELGCFICTTNELGESVSISEADQHIFGYVLVNDWSARDIQRWEYVPLGPFNAKNFATSISPWVISPDALEPFRVPAIANPSQPLQSYLEDQWLETVFDLQLEVDLKSSDGHTFTLFRMSSRHLLWSFPQMIAHHTLGGCSLRTGDLLATGTISGPGGASDSSSGSLIEATEGGRRPIAVPGGRSLLYLADGDTVILRGWGIANGFRVGFGTCDGTILPAS